MTTSQASDLWLGELVRSGRRPRTIDAYRRLLDKLASFYPLVDVEDVSPTMCRRFLDQWSGSAPGTMAQVVSCLTGFFGWLRDESLIKTTPMERIRRPKRTPDDENDRIVSVSEDDVRKLLAAARGWNERLALNVALYLGPRRRALAEVRRGDYDPRARTLTFREKGARTIRKPVPDLLAEIIDAAIAAGVYASERDYLIPGGAPQVRDGERDDRVIWRLVKKVAQRAGVETHVHALRAAFACHFLQAHPGELIALQRLMGHSKISTTEVYLRRLDRAQAMEVVRDLAWSAPQDTSGSLSTLLLHEATQAGSADRGALRQRRLARGGRQG